MNEKMLLFFGLMPCAGALTAATSLRCCVVGRQPLRLASSPLFIYHAEVGPSLAGSGSRAGLRCGRGRCAAQGKSRLSPCDAVSVRRQSAWSDEMHVSYRRYGYPSLE